MIYIELILSRETISVNVGRYTGFRMKGGWGAQVKAACEMP